MEKNEKRNSPIVFDTRELYSSRIVILIEAGPQENKYFQIVLTKEEWMKVSAVLQAQMPHCEDKSHKHDSNCHIMTVKDDVSFPLLDSLKTWYTQDEIDNEKI